MTKLISYKGRRFVALCNCNSKWDTKSFVNGTITTLDRMLCEKYAKCDKCGFYPWITLPKGEKV